MKKTMLLLAALLCFFIVLILIVVKTMPYFAPVKYSTSSLFFANAQNLSGIVIKKRYQKIKLRKINGVWYCNGYFARNKLMDEYINRLSKTIIKDSYTGPINPKTEFEYTTDDKKNFMFNAVSLGDKNQSVVAFRNRKYVLDSDIGLPDDIREYFVQPLLPLQNKTIENHEEDIGLYGSLQYIGARKSLPSMGNDVQYKSFVLVTKDGIKFICGLYKQADSYWMTVNLKTTIMPTIQAENYVKDNQYRYDGWYFAIAPEDGIRLWTQIKEQ